MSNEATEKFIEEGFKRYKEASKVMVSFGEKLESRLQSILENRFTKKEARAKSTKYGSRYPLFNAKEVIKTHKTHYWSEKLEFKAKLEGKLKDQDIVILIAVNWYSSESDDPFYSVWMEDSGTTLEKTLEDKFKQFEWGSTVSVKYIDGKNRLAYIPKPEDFNLERDFKILLDEFNRFLNVL